MPDGAPNSVGLYRKVIVVMDKQISVFVQDNGNIGLYCSLCDRPFWQFTRSAISIQELTQKVTSHVWSNSVRHSKIEGEAS